MPIAKEILNMLENDCKPSQVISVVFLDRKWQKLQRITPNPNLKCKPNPKIQEAHSHCAMDLDCPIA